MCKYCIKICNDIENIFGHIIEPNILEELIESSPLSTKKLNIQLQNQKIKMLNKSYVKKLID